MIYNRFCIKCKYISIVRIERAETAFLVPFGNSNEPSHAWHYP